MKFTNETKIGIMVTGVLVVLAFLTFKTGNYRVSVKGYELKVHFYNIDGVDKNAPVRLNGMEVGAVKDMRIAYGEDSKMELTLSIFGETKIHEGAKAFVKNMGLFGEKYVGLTLGDSTKDYLKPGAARGCLLVALRWPVPTCPYGSLPVTATRCRSEATT